MLRHKYRHTGNYPQERRDLMLMKQRTAQCNRKKTQTQQIEAKTKERRKNNFIFTLLNEKKTTGKKMLLLFCCCSDRDDANERHSTHYLSRSIM